MNKPKFKVGDNVMDCLNFNTKGIVKGVYENIEGAEECRKFPFLYMIDNHGFHVPLFENQLIYTGDFDAKD